MAQGKAYTKEQREEIILSLKDSLELGFSRNKACEMVGLPPQTLSNWVVADEALGMKLQNWENAINRIAMSNIRQQITAEVNEEDNKKEMTKWWAERKMKNEFSTKTEVDQKTTIEIAEEKKEAISNAIDEVL